MKSPDHQTANSVFPIHVNSMDTSGLLPLGSLLQINVSLRLELIKSCLWWVGKAWRAKKLFVSFLSMLGAAKSGVRSLLGGKNHSPVNFIFSQGWWVLSGADIPLPHQCGSPLLLPGDLCSLTGLKSNKKCQRRAHGTYYKRRFFHKPLTQVFYYSSQWILPFLHKISYCPVRER